MDDTRSLHSQSIGDIAWLLLCTVIENFGYRQMLAVWRFAAMIDLLAGREGALGPAGAQRVPDGVALGRARGRTSGAREQRADARAQLADHERLRHVV